MIDCLLMFVSVAFAVANGCILHYFANRDIKNLGETFYFNGGISLMWILLLSLLSVISGDFGLSGGSVFYGCVYGVIICSFLLLKNLSLTNGPVSLTMLIGSCPFLLTTPFGIIFLHNTISVYQIIGTVLIIVALFLCLNQTKRGDSANNKLTTKWFILCALFFLAGGGVGIVYMLFGASDSAREINGMMLCAAVVASLLYFIVGFIVNAIRKDEPPKIHKSGILYFVLCGVASCTYMRMNLWLSTVIPSVIFFPIANGSIVLFSTVSSGIIFRERLSKRQIIGMLIGVIAIVLVGLG